MSDWDSDGDTDFTDGLIEGIVWFGPGWLVLLVLAVCLALYLLA